MIKKLICLISICFSFVGMAFAENYAVLVSAGKTYSDNTDLNSMYWYELYLAYEYLLGTENYDSTNVYVFYGDGVDYNSDIPRFQPSFNNWGTITDYNNSYSTMCNVLSSLNEVMTDDDNLLFHWVIGHGNFIRQNPDNYIAFIENRNTELSKSQVKDMVDLISHYNKRKIIWNTCHSGCIGVGSINLNNDKTVILTATSFDKESYLFDYNLISNGCSMTCFTHALYSIGTGHFPHEALNLNLHAGWNRPVYYYLTHISDKYYRMSYDDSIISFYDMYLLLAKMNYYYYSLFSQPDDCIYNHQLYGSELAKKVFIREDQTIQNKTLTLNESYWLNQLEINNVSVANNKNIDLDIDIDDHFLIESNTSIPVGSTLLVK